ncbi:hypothetical protein XENOCAPTIV_028983, partial [Xenoophorus captivus]
QTLLFCHADVSSSPLSHLVEVGTPVIGNDELEKNLVQVEKVALNRGLSPEALSVMVEFAMSLRMGKPKLNHLELPAMSAVTNKEPQMEQTSRRKLVPLVQIQSFSQLLENMYRIEPFLCFLSSCFYLHQLPSQMGSLLGSSLALQYLDCVQDESALLRLNFWLGYALHEEIKTLLFEPLMQLFFTSSLFFKCGLIECLNHMLLKWLTWHSVYALEDDLDISLNSHTSM